MNAYDAITAAIIVLPCVVGAYRARLITRDERLALAERDERHREETRALTERWVSAEAKATERAQQHDADRRAWQEQAGALSRRVEHIEQRVNNQLVRR